MLRAKRLVGRAGRGIVGEREARGIGVERRAPFLLIGGVGAEQRQGGGGVRRGAGALVGPVGGGEGLTPQARAALVIVLLRLARRRFRRAGIGAPVGRIAGIGRDGGGQRRQGLGGLVGFEQPLALAAGLRGGGERPAGLGLQRGFEADGVAGEAGADEAPREGGGCRLRLRERRHRQEQGGEAARDRLDPPPRHGALPRRRDANRGGPRGGDYRRRRKGTGRIIIPPHPEVPRAASKEPSRAPRSLEPSFEAAHAHSG